MIIICEQCGKEAEKKLGHVNRARKLGLNIYCNRECAGISRRKNYTEEEKKAIKRDYDKGYVEKNRDKLKQKKHEYYKKTYDPKKAAIERKAKYARHIAYLRKPEYVEWKKAYDQRYQAKKAFGEYWECSILIKQIESQYSNKEIREINNLNNKSRKRKRQWQRKRKNSLLKI